MRVSLSVVSLCDPRTVARQAPLSMGFSRRECWRRLSLPPPRDPPDRGMQPGSPALQAASLASEPPEKPVAQSPCYTPETNTTLQINSASIKKRNEGSRGRVGAGESSRGLHPGLRRPQGSSPTSRTWPREGASEPPAGRWAALGLLPQECQRRREGTLAASPEQLLPPPLIPPSFPLPPWDTGLAEGRPGREGRLCTDLWPLFSPPSAWASSPRLPGKGREGPRRQGITPTAT